MEHKIFLGKYRVAADEIALSGAEPAGGVAVTEQTQTAVIYRGEEIESGRDVAIEVIPAGPYKTVVREELDAEALAARKINHVNIPAIYDFGVEDDQLIYVTEYFDGTSAEEWVNQHGPMPTGAVLRIALQVVSAMGACAFHKISHHAINPGNLMLVPGQTPEGDWPLIKVLHFVGVAPTFTSPETAVSTSVATFDKSSHYASPEQLQHGIVDFRSEIYSLGATMWFLLTGAPPLIAPNGPLAMQPTTNGLAVDKLSGMPKRVRRLLAQMLSVKPEDRPQDPLAFYRQIQDCLAQVDRRETMARRFGVPLFSRSSAAHLPPRRRFPAKALALAAALLALATLAAFIIPEYLRHQRVRQAEEPIGVPIGVPEATESAPPVVADSTTASNPPQTQTETTVASTNTTQNAPPTSTQQEAPAPNAPDSPPVVAANTAETAPAQPAPAAPPQNIEPPAPTVAANEVAAAPVKPLPTAEPVAVQPEKSTKAESNQVASAPVEPLPAAEPPKVQAEESSKLAANDPAPPQPEVTERKPTETVRMEKREVRSNRQTDVAAIPTARPVAPEVRRAEPAPPAEGPEDEEEVAMADTGADVVPVPTSRTKKERLAKSKRAPRTEARPEFVITDETEEVDESAPKAPKGRVRARFIGVTADGNWMLALPKDKIVIVPPPPGG